MTSTNELYRAGQSIWLDNITRPLLTSGSLARYVEDYSVTGLMSDRTAFYNAIKHGAAYDAAIDRLARAGSSAENLLLELALQDVTRAADILRPIHERTAGVDGWVSLDVAPSLAHHTGATLAKATELHVRARRPNILIQIPGTAEGLPAIEETVFAGVPVNVSLLFSVEQYLAAAGACLRGIERRIAAGLNPNVASVASVVISRWDAVVAGGAPPRLANTLGLAMAESVYKTYTRLRGSAGWLRAFNAGARPQRLLFASTGPRDAAGPDIRYARALIAPLTITSMSETTLRAFVEHGEWDVELAVDGGDCEMVFAEFERAGIALDELAERLQDAEAAALGASWDDTLKLIAARGRALERAC